MKSTTPYWTRPASQRDHKARCMGSILSRATPVPLIYEAFGGIGITATILSRLFPYSKIRSFDIDKKCVQFYNDQHIQNARALCEDSLLGFRTLKPTGEWAASLDFNLFTILDITRKRNRSYPLLASVVERRPRWIQLTDSAVKYLHLNYESYGLKASNSEHYVARLNKELGERWGLEHVAHEGSTSATYLLYQQGAQSNTLKLT